MDKSSYELSVIAYYLSKFDMKAVRSLGYKTRTEAFIAISEIMGRPNNYLKLRRDEFDVLTDSTRKGWHNRPVNSEVKKIFDELSVLSRSDLEIRINGQHVNPQNYLYK